MKVLVAVASHKEYEMPDDPMYLPVWAGAAIRLPASDASLAPHPGSSLTGSRCEYIRHDDPAGWARDDTGYNISDRNGDYSELTVLYWLWKNYGAPDSAVSCIPAGDGCSRYECSDALGLCHYRRYFIQGAKLRLPYLIGAGDAVSTRLRHERRHDLNTQVYGSIITEHEARELLENSDIILPAPRHYVIETNYSQYANSHGSIGLDTARKVIARDYPEYLASFDAVMNKRSGHRFNMFIMKRDIFNEYCTWLFDILFKTDELLGDRPTGGRLMGYISERLLDVWLEERGYSFAEVPYIMTEPEHLIVKGLRLMGRKLRSQKYK